MPRADVAVRANRISGLAKIAADLFAQGLTEDEVRQRLKEIARRNWSPSFNTLSDYVENAIAKAKPQ